MAGAASALGLNRSAYDNGSSDSHESYRGNRRRLFNGLALVMPRSASCHVD